MKKHISVFLLMVRTSIWKALLILAAMAVAQVALFFIMGAGEQAYLLDALERIPSSYVVIVGLNLLAAGLYAPLSDQGGRMNHLILRLGLPEKRIFWIQVLVNAGIYGLFIMGQGMIMLLLCMIYDWVTPGNLDPMAIFVTSYQHPLFHRFFPLHNPVGWINHLILVTGLSICTAAFPMRQRHRYNNACSIIMTVYAALYYGSLAGDHLHSSEMLFPSLTTAILVIAVLFSVMTMEVDDYGKA